MAGVAPELKALIDRGGVVSTSDNGLFKRKVGTGVRRKKSWGC